MILLDLYISILGLFLGSYIYTTASRLVKEVSLWSWSSCDHCQKRIVWYGLIPLIGYLVLRGRCNRCGSKVAKVYPITELINAVAVFSIFRHTGFEIEFIGHLIFFECLFVIAVIDFLTYKVYAQPVLIAFTFRTGWLFFYDRSGIIDSILGLLIGAGIFHWIAYFYQSTRNKIGLGQGDATLLGLIGFGLGWKLLLPVIFWSAVFGIIGGWITLKLQKKSLEKEIAFGPWLVIAAFFVWLLPEVFQVFFFMESIPRF
ncbi:MAG: prepilin peptidase [Deltaproteobacteria bacterium]|nr:prepilin peptidase [Deltaproteobacteria bacterium]